MCGWCGRGRRPRGAGSLTLSGAGSLPLTSANTTLCNTSRQREPPRACAWGVAGWGYGGGGYGRAVGKGARSRRPAGHHTRGTAPHKKPRKMAQKRKRNGRRKQVICVIACQLPVEGGGRRRDEEHQAHALLSLLSSCPPPLDPRMYVCFYVWVLPPHIDPRARGPSNLPPDPPPAHGARSEARHVVQRTCSCTQPTCTCTHRRKH
jgi:hypothetical protein